MATALHNLSEYDLATLETGRTNKEGEPVHLGSTIAAKLIASIEASKARPFGRVLFGLGIRHVGIRLEIAMIFAGYCWVY